MFFNSEFLSFLNFFSIRDFVQFGSFSIRDFVRSRVCLSRILSIQDFVQFGILSNLGFCPIWHFFQSGFCPLGVLSNSGFCPIQDFVDFGIFYRIQVFH